MAEYAPTRIFSGCMDEIAAHYGVECLYRGRDHRLYITNINAQTAFFGPLCRAIQNSSAISWLGIDTASVSVKHMAKMFKTLQRNDSIVSIILYPYDKYLNMPFFFTSFLTTKAKRALSCAFHLNPRIQDINWHGFIQNTKDPIQFFSPPSMVQRKNKKMSHDDIIPATRPSQVLRRLFSQDKSMRQIVIAYYSKTCTHYDAKNDIVVMLDALCMFQNSVDTLKLAEDTFPDNMWHALINFITTSTTLVRLEVICRTYIPSFGLRMLAREFNYEVVDGNYSFLYVGIVRFSAINSNESMQLVIELK